MELSELVPVCAGLFLAGVVKGATGLGYASCALPFLAAALGLKAAMTLVLVPAMATNLTVALSAGHLREMAARFLPLYAAMLPGIAVGVSLLIVVEQRLASALLGAVMTLYAGVSLARPRLALAEPWQRPLQIPVGALNGIVTGLTGSQVMPLFPYIMALGLDPARMVQAINLAVIIASLVLGIGLAAVGLMTRELLLLSVAAVVPAVAGTAVGGRLRERIPVERFRALALVTIGLMGAVMLARSWPWDGLASRI